MLVGIHVPRSLSTQALLFYATTPRYYLAPCLSVGACVVVSECLGIMDIPICSAGYRSPTFERKNAQITLKHGVPLVFIYTGTHFSLLAVNVVVIVV